MTPRKPRIAISLEALRILKAIAALEGIEPDEYLSALVMRERPRILEALEGKGRGMSSAIENPIKPDAVSKNQPEKIAHTKKHHGGKPGLSEEMKARILELWQDGKGDKSQRTIARELNVNQSTVSKLLKKSND